ncbi:MAG TPA: site-2 protease family protein [Chloroflexi bacterium]|nr:site-2 protease family protein [Chloroflexota bacterium]
MSMRWNGNDANNVPELEPSATNSLVLIAQLRQQLHDVMEITGYIVLEHPDEAFAFRGRLYAGTDVDVAFERISQRFARYGYTASLRRLPSGDFEVHAIKGLVERRPGRVWINAVLLLLTLVSVLYIGAASVLQESGAITNPNDPQVLFLPLAHLQLGIPFAATLMSILLAHELSHYFVARRYGSPVSLPYFIPMPLSIIGTMGAVIVQRAPMRSRKALFDIGIAGPLGGLVIAIPLVIVGLTLSTVQPPPPNVDTVLQEGNSLLYAGLKYLVFGKMLPGNGEDVWLHPVAFAAWSGLLVTMINLIPVGQLDGGHISYALLGNRAHKLGQVVIVGMFAWGGWLLMSGNNAGGFWLTWAVLNLMLNPRHPPPLNDAGRLDRTRIVVGIIMLGIFILLFMPSPLQQITLR